jgi:hypothetical protein
LFLIKGLVLAQVIAYRLSNTLFNAFPCLVFK